MTMDYTTEAQAAVDRGNAAMLAAAQCERIVDIMREHNSGSMETASDVCQRLWINGPRVTAVELALLCELQEGRDGSTVQRILGDYVQPADGFEALAEQAMQAIEARGLI